MLNRLQESDIKLLRVFYAVASCNGFTAAEPVLRMQRPNISAAIKKLEERLDLVLCLDLVLLELLLELYFNDKI